MTFKEFEKFVAGCVERLPEEFKGLLVQNSIAVIARDKTPEPLKRQYPDSVVYGIFIGVPFGRFVHLQSEPTRIELYRESFAEFKTPAEMERQIMTTVVHEVGHYLGFSEEDLSKHGY